MAGWHAALLLAWGNVDREGIMVSISNCFKLFWATSSNSKLPQVTLTDLSYTYLGEATLTKWPWSMQAEGREFGVDFGPSDLGQITQAKLSKINHLGQVT